MLDAFKKWTLFHHTFPFVKLTPAEVDSLGAGTQQFLEKEEGEDGNAVMVTGIEATKTYSRSSETAQLCMKPEMRVETFEL